MPEYTSKNPFIRALEAAKTNEAKEKIRNLKKLTNRLMREMDLTYEHIVEAAKNNVRWTTFTYHVTPYPLGDRVFLSFWPRRQMTEEQMIKKHGVWSDVQGVPLPTEDEIVKVLNEIKTVKARAKV
tara:strand:- start:64 stop:441 length:378 start_codon:yes stop_codon:yes gene_type:complete